MGTMKPVDDDKERDTQNNTKQISMQILQIYMISDPLPDMFSIP